MLQHFKHDVDHGTPARMSAETVTQHIHADQHAEQKLGAKRRIRTTNHFGLMRLRQPSFHLITSGLRA